MMRSRTRLSVLATTVVVVLLLCAGFAIAFSDVSSGDDYAEAINELSSLGIIDGKADGTFRPRELVTRQQFAKMIVLTLGLPVTESDVCPFSDVDLSGPGDLFPDNYVAVAAAQGITKGVSGNCIRSLEQHLPRPGHEHGGPRGPSGRRLVESTHQCVLRRLQVHPAALR